MSFILKKVAPLLSVLLALTLSGAHSEVLPNPLPCAPCFIGKLKLGENPADPSGKTKRLLNDLYFVDPQKFVWKAGKDDITDGASIPELFQPVVGGPYEADYLPAAVIHDHYTDKAHRVRSWRDTARVFYQAMVVNGVGIVKAKTMYFAVYSFGPHWGEIAKGIPCGKNCVFSTPFEFSVQSDGNILTTEILQAVPSGMQFAEQPADYSESHASELGDIQSKIEAAEILGDPLSLYDLDREATLTHKDNVFIATDNTR